MHNLRSLPKNPGDNILLGTLLAVGIQPNDTGGRVFATFDCNGEAHTYHIEHADMLDHLLGILRNNYINEQEVNQFKPDLKNNTRHDYRFECDTYTLNSKVFKLIPLDGSDEIIISI